MTPRLRRGGHERAIPRIASCPLLIHWQVERERRSLAFARVHDDVPSVIEGHVTHDTEAQSCPAGFARATWVDPVEAFEDPLEVLGGDAHALVLDRDTDEGSD